MRGPLVRSTSSDIARNVGSSSRPAASARAAAASVSSAVARSSGLSCRPSARTLSTVAPGTPEFCDAAGPLAAKAMKTAAATAPQHDRASMLLRQVEDHGPADRLALPLHLGRQRQHPLAGHP